MLQKDFNSMLIKCIYNKIVHHSWELGFIDSPIRDIIEGKECQIKYVKFPFEGRWYADPFILDYNDEVILLLVEDFSDTDQKGRISKLVIDRKTMKIKSVNVVLSRPTHLSFPAIIRDGTKCYLYPENSQNGGLWMYEYDINSDRCEPFCQLSDMPLTDAIISPLLGKELLFSTKEPNPNQNILGVYVKNENNEFEFSQQIVFDENIARNAGDFFEYNGLVYRPAQECNSMYGHALSIQRISKEGGVIKMKEVRRIMPPRHAIGIHTFNVYKDLTVVDVKVFRHPWIAFPLFKFRNLFKKQ